MVAQDQIAEKEKFQIVARLSSRPSNWDGVIINSKNLLAVFKLFLWLPEKLIARRWVLPRLCCTGARKLLPDADQNPYLPEESGGLGMNAKFVVVASLSALAIALYWFPVPLTLGDYVLGGYPWLAPEGAKQGIIALGVILSAVFLGLTGFMWYLTRKLEENPGEEDAGAAEELPGGVQW